MNTYAIYEKFQHGDITAIINRASEIRGKVIYRDAWYRYIKPEVRRRMSVEIVEAISRAVREVKETKKPAPAA